jgi:hypothetical protein
MYTKALITILALMLMIGVPLAAQDDVITDELTDEDAIVLVGTINFTVDGDLVMTTTNEETGADEMFIIAPAGAFRPSSVEDDDVVIIVGRLLPDGLTVQAAEFEFFVEEEDEEAVEEPVEAVEEPVEEEVEEPIDEEPVESCGNSSHPVAARLAEAFEMSADDIMAMHCDGNGFGNIARALLLAENDLDGATAQDFLDRHHGGEGWGQIVRESGMHPRDFAPGLIGRHNDDETEIETTSASRPGNGNGHGNGNGGNGNGNGGGNGRGNSGGKGK